MQHNVLTEKTHLPVNYHHWMRHTNLSTSRILSSQEKGLLCEEFITHVAQNSLLRICKCETLETKR